MSRLRFLTAVRASGWNVQSVEFNEDGAMA